LFVAGGDLLGLENGLLGFYGEIVVSHVLGLESAKIRLVSSDKGFFSSGEAKQIYRQHQTDGFFRKK